MSLILLTTGIASAANANIQDKQLIAQTNSQANNCSSIIHDAVTFDYEIQTYVNQMPADAILTTDEQLQWADLFEAMGYIFDHAYYCNSDYAFAQKRDIYYDAASNLRNATNVLSSSNDSEEYTPIWESESCYEPAHREFCQDLFDSHMETIEFIRQGIF